MNESDQGAKQNSLLIRSETEKSDQDDMNYISGLAFQWDSFQRGPAILQSNSLKVKAEVKLGVKKPKPSKRLVFNIKMESYCHSICTEHETDNFNNVFIETNKEEYGAHTLHKENIWNFMGKHVSKWLFSHDTL